MSIWNINVLWSKGRNSSADLWALYSGSKPFLNILVNLCSLFTHLMPKDLLLLSQIVNYTWTNVANSEVDKSRAAEILHTLEERPIQSKGHLLSPNFLNRLHNVPTCAIEHWSSLLEARERKEEKKNTVRLLICDTSVQGEGEKHTFQWQSRGRWQGFNILLNDT